MLYLLLQSHNMLGQVWAAEHCHDFAIYLLASLLSVLTLLNGPEFAGHVVPQLLLSLAQGNILGCSKICRRFCTSVNKPHLNCSEIGNGMCKENAHVFNKYT